MSDIDECIDGTKRCWPGSKCMNIPGSFICEDGKKWIKLAVAGICPFIYKSIQNYNELVAA